jgi:RNA polymerase sigma-70 factor (ECF subfamily)
MLDRHGPAIYRLAVSIVRDPALAEDVAQETFIRAWRHGDTYRGTAPVRHWLLRIAHNVAVSTLRSLREEARDPGTLPVHHGEAMESAVDNRMAIQQALSRLDPLSRSIVVLREMEGLGYAEIGEILGITLPTVKTRLFRARATLRETMREVRR